MPVVSVHLDQARRSGQRPEEVRERLLERLDQTKQVVSAHLDQAKRRSEEVISVQKKAREMVSVRLDQAKRSGQRKSVRGRMIEIVDLKVVGAVAWLFVRKRKTKDGNHKISSSSQVRVAETLAIQCFVKSQRVDSC